MVFIKAFFGNLRNMSELANALAHLIVTSLPVTEPGPHLAWSLSTGFLSACFAGLGDKLVAKPGDFGSRVDDASIFGNTYKLL